MAEFLILNGIVLLILSQAESATEEGLTEKDADRHLHNRREAVQREEIRETHRAMFTKGGMVLF